MLVVKTLRTIKVSEATCILISRNPRMDVNASTIRRKFMSTVSENGNIISIESHSAVAIK